MKKQSGTMERNALIRTLEQEIHHLELVMHQAAMSNNDKVLGGLFEDWRQAQGKWLQVARGMSPEKAQAVMIGFAVGELQKWMDERRPGPPPSVMTLYPDGAISDDDFGKLRRL